MVDSWVLEVTRSGGGPGLMHRAAYGPAALGPCRTVCSTLAACFRPVAPTQCWAPRPPVPPLPQLSWSAVPTHKPHRALPDGQEPHEGRESCGRGRPLPRAGHSARKGGRGCRGRASGDVGYTPQRWLVVLLLVSCLSLNLRTVCTDHFRGLSEQLPPEVPLH